MRIGNASKLFDIYSKYMLYCNYIISLELCQSSVVRVYGVSGDRILEHLFNVHYLRSYYHDYIVNNTRHVKTNE